MFTRITHNVHVVIVQCVSYIALGRWPRAIEHIVLFPAHRQK